MAKVKINGTIVSSNDKWIYDLYEIESFAPSDLYKVLNDNTEVEPLDIEINSPGGYVFDGSEIYTALLNHKGKVTVTITGIAASMASVIAMAGDTVKISPTAQIMIHNASGRVAGDYRDMEHYANTLRKTNDTIANAYVSKTGLSKDDLLSLMDDETWLTPDDALTYGFADEILGNQGGELQLVAGFEPNLLPNEVINKVKRDKELAQIEILKLKGDVI
jgi:ATP-dependent Clp endopeptidase proteolytic subunit ClpP